MQNAYSINQSDTLPLNFMNEGWPRLAEALDKAGRGTGRRAYAYGITTENA